MKTSITHKIICTVLFITSQHCGHAQLALANEGFETAESTDDDWPATFGNWSGDYSQIRLSPTLGISPRSGLGMLRLINTDTDPGGGGINGGSCQVLQLIDLAPVRTQLDLGYIVTVTLRGFFNRVAGDAETDTAFGILVAAFEGLPSAFPTVWEQQAYLRAESRSILSDGDVSTWEDLATSLVVPKRATYLAVQLRASENIHNDATAPELDGHFADDVSVTVEVSLPPLSIVCSAVDVCWDTFPNQTYQVDYRSSLTTHIWTPLGSPLLGSGSRTCIVDIIRGEPQRYYRVRLAD